MIFKKDVLYLPILEKDWEAEGDGDGQHKDSVENGQHN